MHVLVLNSGSSSLKFHLFTVDGTTSDGVSETIRPLLGGIIEHIGGAAVLHLTSENSSPSESERQIPDHAAAVRWLFEHLQSGATGMSPIDQVNAVGHRVVHGGARFSQAIRIDEQIVAELETLSELAPLHNPASLTGIRGAQDLLGSDVPMVAVFDTAFHHNMPAHASTYALPHALAAQHRIRRYGFHGIAHASLADGYARTTGQRLADTRLITLHLGNGCSATAIQQGQSVDTSMGFTPLEGLVMGTRSGDLDPAVVSYLARHTSMSVEAVERLLNEESGLHGVSGRSHDMRTLLAAAEQQQDARATLAITLFCYRVRKYIGAYLAVLGGADAVIFGGGIGEHAPTIRTRICTGMEWCGLRLDAARNAAAVGLSPGSATRISNDHASLAAYVVATDEETWIARETVRCLRDAGHPQQE